MVYILDYLLLTLGSSLRLRRNPRRLGDFWEFISRCIGFWETAIAVIVHSKKTVFYISSSWVKLSLSVSAFKGLLIPMDLLHKLVGSSMEREVMFCWFQDGRRVAFLDGLRSEVSARNLQVRKVKLRGRTVESCDIGRIDVNLPTVHKAHKLPEVHGLVLVDFDDNMVAKRWGLLAFLFGFLGHGRLSLSFKNQVVKDSTSYG